MIAAVKTLINIEDLIHMKHQNRIDVLSLKLNSWYSLFHPQSCGVLLTLQYSAPLSSNFSAVTRSPTPPKVMICPSYTIIVVRYTGVGFTSLLRATIFHSYVLRSSRYRSELKLYLFHPPYRIRRKHTFVNRVPCAARRHALGNATTTCRRCGIHLSRYWSRLLSGD